MTDIINKRSRVTEVNKTTLNSWKIKKSNNKLTDLEIATSTNLSRGTINRVFTIGMANDEVKEKLIFFFSNL